jgi:hypothetical protein
MKATIVQTVLVAFLLAVGGWALGTVYALDKSYDTIQYRLDLVEENFNMIRDLWIAGGHDAE